MAGSFFSTCLYWPVAAYQLPQVSPFFPLLALLDRHFTTHNECAPLLKDVAHAIPADNLPNSFKSRREYVLAAVKEGVVFVGGGPSIGDFTCVVAFFCFLELFILYLSSLTRSPSWLALTSGGAWALGQATDAELQWPSAATAAAVSSSSSTESPSPSATRAVSPVSAPPQFERLCHLIQRTVVRYFVAFPPRFPHLPVAKWNHHGSAHFTGLHSSRERRHPHMLPQSQ